MSPERKGVAVFGLVLMVAGGIVFLSTFLIGSQVSPQDVMNGQSVVGQFAGRAVTGMVLVIIGGVLYGVGRSGLAGSGIYPDPEQAVKDLEPWNRAQGHMIDDVVEQIGAVKNLAPGSHEVVKVRCRTCSALNEENAKFCDQCGKPM